MTFHQKIFALFIGISVFVVIIELVRRRKLEEEYSFLWLLIGCVIIVLVLWQNLLDWLTYFIGAKTPTTTIFIFGIVIVMLINLQFSVKITKLNKQVKKMAQQIALLKMKE